MNNHFEKILANLNNQIAKMSRYFLITKTNYLHYTREKQTVWRKYNNYFYTMIILATVIIEDIKELHLKSNLKIYI